MDQPDERTENSAIMTGSPMGNRGTDENPSVAGTWPIGVAAFSGSGNGRMDASGCGSLRRPDAMSLAVLT